MILEWLKPILFLAGWFVLVRWILPALGIPTCMSGSCQIPTDKKPDAPVERSDSGGKA
jgi:hypothetical protein